MSRVILVITLLLLASCGTPRVEMGPKAAATIDQATLQNDAIAETIVGLAPYQAAGIRNNSEVTRKIIRLSSNEEMRKLIYEWDAQYVQRLTQLSEDWKNEKAAYETQISNNEKAFGEAKEEAESASFWLKVGGAFAAAWALMRSLRGPLTVASSALGMPWLATVVDAISGVGNLPKRVENLKTLVTGSDVGIRELERIEAELNEYFDGKIAKRVKELTGEDSLAELVRNSSKAVALLKKAHATSKLELARIRDEEPITELHNKIIK